MGVGLERILHLLCVVRMDEHVLENLPGPHLCRRSLCLVCSVGAHCVEVYSLTIKAGELLLCAPAL